MFKIKLIALWLVLASGLSWAEAEPNKPNAGPDNQSVIQKVVDGTAIDINQASADELATLANIGPKKAQQIVAYRDLNGRFASIEELKGVKGIGEATIEKNRVRMMVAAE